MGRIDPSRAVFGVRVLEDVMDGTIAEPRRNATLVAAFAAAALLLCAVGLYALFARLVAESRREIGVRLALGARPAQIVRLVLSDASRLLLLGASAGGVLSVAAYQLLRSVLFGVGPFDAIAGRRHVGALRGVPARDPCAGLPSVAAHADRSTR